MAIPKGFGVTTGKTAGYKYHLRAVDAFCERPDALRDALGCQIVDNEYFRHRSGISQSFGCVVFAVRTGEYGDKHPWLCASDVRFGPARGAEANGFIFCLSLSRICRIYAFKAAFIYAQKLG